MDVNLLASLTSLDIMTIFIASIKALQIYCFLLPNLDSPNRKLFPRKQPGWHLGLILLHHAYQNTWTFRTILSWISSRSGCILGAHLETYWPGGIPWNPVTWRYTWKSTDLNVGGIDSKVLNPPLVQTVIWLFIRSRNPHEGHFVTLPENIKL